MREVPLAALFSLPLSLLPLAVACDDGDGGADSGVTGADGGTDAGTGDAASTDGGSTDGGSTDGGKTDGGTPDGGAVDGGATDGGTTDGGTTDGGTTDGGTDGGAVSEGWGFGYGRTGVAFQAGQLRVGSDGQIWLTGTVDGTLDLGDGTIVTEGPDLFLGQVSSDVTWEGGVTWGTDDEESAAVVAVHPEGGAVVAGSYTAAIRLDPDTEEETQAPDGGTGAWLSRFDAELELLWAVALAGDNRVEALDVAVMPSGKVVVGGRAVDDTIVFDDDDTLVATATDGWLAAYDDGALSWLTVFDAAAGQAVVVSVSADPTGGIVAAGWFNGQLDADPSDGSDPRDAGMGDTAFVAHLSDNGELDWLHTLGEAADCAITATYVGPLGRIVVGGSLEGQVDLDPGDGTWLADHVDGKEGFVVVFEADGSFASATTFTGNGDDEVTDVALHADGRAFALGPFRRSLTEGKHGATLLDATEPQSTFLIGIDAVGAVDWARQEPALVDMALGPAGNLHLSFVMDDTLDLSLGDGTATYSPIGDSDIALVQVDPDGL